MGRLQAASFRFGFVCVPRRYLLGHPFSYNSNTPRMHVHVRIIIVRAYSSVFRGL